MLTLASLMSKKLPPYSGDYGAKTHTGAVRKVNEDTFSAKPGIGLWLIADGMGGHNCGAVASAIARDTIVGCVSSGQGLSESFQIAHNKITSEAKENEDYSGMGSTVVAVLLDGNEYEVAWIGDSRVYLWDGHLTQLTRDHSYVREMVDSGVISQEEANIHPSRHLITHCLGNDDTDNKLETEICRGCFVHGQELLLCSDGLTDELTDSEIEEVVGIEATAQDRVNNLVELAVAHGGKDNITVVLMTAPEDASDSTTQRETAGLARNVYLVLAGALMAAPVLGLIFYLRQQGLF